MAKPYDATLKDLFRRHACDFAALLGLPDSAQVRLLNVDLASTNVESDIVLAVDAPSECIYDINLQSTWDETTLRRCLVYHALLHSHTARPVCSVVILLRSESNDLRLQAGLDYQLDGSVLRFVPRVLRLWQVPAERLLQAGVGLLPLAVLGQLPGSGERRSQLEGLLRQIDARLQREVTAEESLQLWTATFLLSGLHFKADEVAEVFRRIRGMKESSTYQLILDEGRQLGLNEGRQLGLNEGRQLGLNEGRQLGLNEGRQQGLGEGSVAEARRLLQRLGTQRFGPPTPTQQQTLDALSDLARLEQLCDRLLIAANWDDLLASA